MRRNVSAKHVIAFVLLLHLCGCGRALAAAPIATRLFCPGDCDAGGTVIVGELLVAVNIALGVAPPASCPAVDLDDNRHVTVAELLQAVGAAIEGCATPTPTSTPIPPTSTSTPTNSASPTVDPAPIDTPTPTSSVTPSPSPTETPTISPTPTTDTAEMISVPGCSADLLVDAIESANESARAVIHLPAGCTYELNAANNDDPTFGANGLPIIRADIGIDGNGSTVRGQGPFRIFQVAAGAILRLNDVTLTGGSGGGTTFLKGDGGCIHNQGTAILTNTVLTMNRTPDGPAFETAGRGGAIYNAGTLMATDTTFSQNKTGGRTEPFESQSGLGGSGGDGGAIYSDGGSVTLVRCIVDGNATGNGHRGPTGAAGGAGGGIANREGTVTVIDSTIRANRTGEGGQGGLGTEGGSGGFGGGIYNLGTLAAVGSTISGNVAGNGGLGNPGGLAPPTRGGGGGRGGAVYNLSTMTIVDCTISGNSSGAAGQGYAAQSASDGDGGGIYNTGDGDLRSVTVAHNSARNGRGGGVAMRSDDVRVANSILAENTAGNSPDCDVALEGAVASEGHNLVGRADGCNWSAEIGDQIGTSASPIDPMLGPLQNNGGPTFTHGLVVASPAVDGGDPAGCTDASRATLDEDQRGHARTQDGDGDGESVCDVGAFELERASD